jgi:hypothetical protein
MALLAVAEARPICEMSKTVANSFLIHADGVKWLIALSAAGLGGAAALLEKVQAQPGEVKGFFALTVAALAASVLLGCIYYFRLISAANIYETALRKHVIAGNQAHKFDPDGNTDVTTASNRYRAVYPLVSTTFFSALILIAFGLIFGALRGAPPSKGDDEKITGSAETAPPADRFSLFSTEVRLPKGSRHTHTFLLNDNLGHLWQMLCEKDGRVRFVKVPVEPR